jgi:hypothetical protein
MDAPSRGAGRGMWVPAEHEAVSFPQDIGLLSIVLNPVRHGSGPVAAERRDVPVMGKRACTAATRPRPAPPPRLPDPQLPPAGADLPRWLLILAGGSVIVAVIIFFGVWPLSGGDLLMHLTVGRWIWDHGAVPWVDDFSYVTAGQPFIAHSWGPRCCSICLSAGRGPWGSCCCGWP